MGALSQHHSDWYALNLFAYRTGHLFVTPTQTSSMRSTSTVDFHKAFIQVLTRIAPPHNHTYAAENQSLISEYKSVVENGIWKVGPEDLVPLIKISPIGLIPMPH